MSVDANRWYSHTLANALLAMRGNTYSDNYDFERFGGGPSASSDFMVAERVKGLHWFTFSATQLFEARNILCDEYSKSLYDELISYRLAGHTAWRVPLEFSVTGEAEYLALERENSSRCVLDLQGQFGNPNHLDFSFEGDHFRVDCYSLSYYLFRRQYYFQRDGCPDVCPSAGDVVVDAGACLGDTAAVFSNSVGPGGKVLAFDPVADHIDFLRLNITQFEHSNVEIYGFGLGSEARKVDPVRINRHHPGFKGLIDGQQLEFPTITLDELVADTNQAAVDYIKLDVEGSELAALKGSINTINEFRPKLAVSLYHKPNDIFELTLWLASILRDYDFFLGHYTIHQEETVLYCHPRWR